MLLFIKVLAWIIVGVIALLAIFVLYGIGEYDKIDKQNQKQDYDERLW